MKEAYGNGSSGCYADFVFIFKIRMLASPRSICPAKAGTEACGSITTETVKELYL